MSVAALQAEIIAYDPWTARDVLTDEAFLERQAALWRRLDELHAAGVPLPRTKRPR
jgi:hypothetical protein